MFWVDTMPRIITARNIFFFLTSLLLNPSVSDASPGPCPQDRRVKFLAFLVRVGSGPVSGGHRRAGRGGGAGLGPVTCQLSQGDHTTVSSEHREHKQDKTETQGAFSQHSETFYH